MNLPINVGLPVRITTGEYLSIYLYAKKEIHTSRTFAIDSQRRVENLHRLSKVAIRVIDEFFTRSQLRLDVAWFRREVGISLVTQIFQLNYYCRLSSQWKITRRERRKFRLHIAISQRLVARELTRRMSPLTSHEIHSRNG